MKTKLLIGFLLVATCAGALGWYYYSKEEVVASRYGTETVVNEAFMVAFSEGGTLEAVNSVKIVSKMEGTSTIEFVVEEGTYVTGSKKVIPTAEDTPESLAKGHGIKNEDLRHVNPNLEDAIRNRETITIPGDLLVKLDPKGLERSINTQEAAVQKAENAVVRAEGELKKAKLDTQMALKKAENALQNAALDRDKAEKSTVETFIQDQEGTIENYKKDIELSEKNVRAYDALKELGFVSEVEVLREKAKAAKTAHTMKIALAELAAYKKYDQVKLLSEKQLAVEEAEVNVEKTKVANISDMNDANSTVSTAEKTLELENEKLNDLKDQLTKSRIYAPSDGLVVYHVAESSRYGGSSAMIEKGANIRKGQDILKLPDVSEMMVELKIHESKRDQVQVGYKVQVHVGSYKFEGEISFVAPVASSVSRYGGGKKVYNCQVTIKERIPEGIRPGSSATCHIYVANLPKQYKDARGRKVETLKVPIQSVVETKDGKLVVFTIDDGQPQPTLVETGFYDQTHIQIVAGVKEGATILKAPLLHAKELNVGGGIFGYREIKPEDLGFEVPVYSGLHGANTRTGQSWPTSPSKADRDSPKSTQAASARPDGSEGRPGGGARPGEGGPPPGSGRPGGSSGRSSSSVFEAPAELNLNADQKQKWEEAAEFSKAAFDAAMEQRNFQELRTIREDFKKQIKEFLTADQLAKYDELQPQRGRQSGGRQSGGGRRGGMGSIMDLDEDKDGKVSESEYGKMSERIRQFMGEFNTLDSNGDGGITQEEADDARQRMIQRFQQGGGGLGGGSGGN